MTKTDNSFSAFVSDELVRELKKFYKVSLSRKDDTDWDRGVVWGHQEVIDYLEVVSARQAKQRLKENSTSK